MNDQSLGNVLAILRWISKVNKGTQVASLLNTWVGGELSETQVLKVAGYIQEQIAEAQAFFDASNLSAEAKAGLSSSLARLRATFSLSGLRGDLSAAGDVSSAISNFVILMDSLGLSQRTDPPAEAAELVSEIAELMTAFKDVAIDPIVRDTAQRHLQILSTLLQHIPVFGLEAALATYFELMLKVRRTENGASEATKAKVSPLWDVMEKWSARLGTIDKLWNAGARAVAHADKARGLLSYIPDI